MFHIWSRKRRIWVELTKRNEWGVNKPQDEIPTWNCSYRLWANFVEKKNICNGEMCRVPAHLDNILHRRRLDHAANFRNLCAETSNGRQMCDCVGGVRVSVTSGSLHRTEIWQDTRRRIQFFFLSKSPLDSLEFTKINQTLHSWRQI